MNNLINVVLYWWEYSANGIPKISKSIHWNTRSICTPINNLLKCRVMNFDIYLHGKKENKFDIVNNDMIIKKEIFNEWNENWF